MENQVIRSDSEETSLLNISTNQVLIEESKDKTIYYLPCYIRLKVKTIKELEIEKLSGVVSGTLLFSFYYGNLPQEILSQFTGPEDDKKAILIQLSRQESIELREGKGIIYKEDPGSRIIDYVVRTEFDCHLKGDVFYTPFQILNLHLDITVQTVVLNPKENDGKRISIKFNCMNSEKVTTIDAAPDCQFGTYNLASYYLDRQYTNASSNSFLPISVSNPELRRGSLKKDASPSQKAKKGQDNSGLQQEMSNVKMIEDKLPKPKTNKNKVQLKGSIEQPSNETRVKHFQYTHFRIPLYKYPGSSLLSIFIPLWVLGFINLTIFFQDNRLADKIAVIATITLAFIAFLPTINEKIPQTSSMKLVQVLIYMETGATLLTLMDALTVRFEDNLTYNIRWSENGYFILALLINIFNVVTVVSLFIVHKVWWQKVYLADRDIKITVKLIREHWENKDCDRQFKKWFGANKISILPPELPKIKVGKDTV